ncbi:MAG: Fic family protein [Actinomycetales bacterium]
MTLPEPHEARAIWDDLWHLEAHHSTALEGNTLVLKEVKTLLDSGRAVGAKELKDYVEVQGYGDAAKWVYQQGLSPSQWQHDELIVKTEVRRIHADLMGPVWQVAPHRDASDLEGPGQFRRHEIIAFSGGMTPPSFVQIDSDLGLWIDAVNELGAQVKGKTLEASLVPERLAGIHRNFEAIHPFIDGNGRTGRLVLNLILIRLGWPPAIIFKKHRSRYLTALDKADKGDLGPLAEQICRSVIDNLHHLIPEIAGPSKFVPLQALQDDTMSYSALRQAATRGRLEAVQETGRVLALQPACSRRVSAKALFARCGKGAPVRTFVPRLTNERQVTRPVPPPYSTAGSRVPAPARLVASVSSPL